MRKRKFIIVGLLVLLATGIAAFLFLRDSGPPVQVTGNFTAKDVAEIKRAVRQRLWHEVLPDLSGKSIKGFPHNFKRVFTTHVVSISGWGAYVKERTYALVLFETNSPGIGCILTNGPLGWSWYSGYAFYNFDDSHTLIITNR